MRRPAEVARGSEGGVRTARAVQGGIPAPEARWRVPMGLRYGYAAPGVGWLVDRLHRIVRRHHRAQTGGRIVAPEGVGAQGSAATRGHWQLAMERGTDEVVWSDELFRIAGLDPGSPAAVASNHRHLYPLEHWERIRRCADEALRSGTPYELDVEMFSGGSRRWVTARGEAMRDADGRIMGFEALSRTSRNASSVNGRSICSATCSTAPTIRSRSSTPRRGDSST